MAKLPPYVYFEGHIGHITINFMTSQPLMTSNEPNIIVFSAPPIQMKIWLTPWHPPHPNVLEKNCLSQIECWNLENEAKTTRNATNLSVNFVDAN